MQARARFWLAVVMGVAFLAAGILAYLGGPWTIPFWVAVAALLCLVALDLARGRSRAAPTRREESGGDTSGTLVAVTAGGIAGSDGRHRHDGHDGNDAGGDSSGGDGSGGADGGSSGGGDGGGGGGGE